MPTASPRRLLLAAFVLVSLLVVLYVRNDSGATKATWDRVGSYLDSATKQSSIGNSPNLRPVDQWDPPIKQYDPSHFDESNPMWFTFNRIDEQYETGTKKLEGAHQSSQKTWPYSYPEENPAGASTPADNNDIVPCKGPRGQVLDGRSRKDNVQVNPGKPLSFANSLLGSGELVGFEQDVCYDRYGRWGAYGYNNPLFREQNNDWDKVNWGQLQTECLEANKHRFDFSSKISLKKVKTGKVERTAVVFRLHENAVYTRDVRRNMRAIIQELALQTGGEYQAFALVEMKDPNIPLDTLEEQKAAVDAFIPPEFRDITILWNQWRWIDDYPLLPPFELGVHLSQWLSMQWFQRTHPEFDFFFNWEMDVRYTGHNYEWLKAVDKWTSEQPRKGLWERNERFYIPRLHGSWGRYRELVQNRFVIQGNDTSIWGPQLDQFSGASEEQYTWSKELENVYPPVSNPGDDKYEWGVGEKADLITFLPQFNPSHTAYVYEDNFYHYSRKNPDDPEPGTEGVPEQRHDSTIPRRVTIITFARISARLLHLMELENTNKPAHHMSSEMWPHSTSLHHGLKSVSVPHGIYFENDWPLKAADWVFNSGDQEEIINGIGQEDIDRRGEGSGGPESSFGLAREHSWLGSTWYYQNGLAERLYKRWMGHEVDYVGGREWERENGIYCLPPMMLHPVKSIEDPVVY